MSVRTNWHRLVGILAALAAVSLGQVAQAANGGDYATMAVNMILLAVILAAVFLWFYSIVA
jgi:hypothetical protein